MSTPQEFRQLQKQHLRQSGGEYYRPLFSRQSLLIGATKGSMTIAAAPEVFTGHLDPNFVFWETNQPGTDTGAVKVDMEIRSASHKHQFGIFDRHSRSLCLTQGQIVMFCDDHREDLLQANIDTFFLFEIRRKNQKANDLFVTCVEVSGDELNVHVCRFEFAYLWRAGRRHQLVVKSQFLT